MEFISRAIDENKISLRTLATTNYNGSVDGDSIIEAYISTLNSEQTRIAYRRSIRDFFTYLYKDTTLSVEMLVINPPEAYSYANYWKRKIQKGEEKKKGEIKRATYNAKIKGVKSFFDWLNKITADNLTGRRLFVENPFATVKIMSETDSEGSMPLTSEEIILMLDNPYGHSQHIQERNKLLLEIAVTTGIRNNALLALTDENLKIIDGIQLIHLIDKGNKISKKPIPHYYDRLVNWYTTDCFMRKNDCRKIFNLTAKGANDVITKWAKAVGIEKRVTFHSLRTTTAVQIYNREGNSIDSAQTFLNHTHRETTQIYLNKTKDVNMTGTDIIEDMRRVEAFTAEMDNYSKEDIVKALDTLPSSVKNLIINALK
jgi:integrase/recombinase XerC